LNPPLYINLAFELANKYAPNTALVINQHGGMEELMWDKVKALVPYLRQQGLRIDGIGWQAAYRRRLGTGEQ
jgi:GH35 family endo-1,4-beta-xylanase